MAGQESHIKIHVLLVLKLSYYQKHFLGLLFLWSRCLESQKSSMKDLHGVANKYKYTLAFTIIPLNSAYLNMKIKCRTVKTI